MEEKLKQLLMRFGFAEIIGTFEQNSILTVDDFMACKFDEFVGFGIDDEKSGRLCILSDRISTILSEQQKKNVIQDSSNTKHPVDPEAQKKSKSVKGWAFMILGAIVIFSLLGLVMARSNSRGSTASANTKTSAINIASESNTGKSIVGTWTATTYENGLTLYYKLTINSDGSMKNVISGKEFDKKYDFTTTYSGEMIASYSKKTNTTGEIVLSSGYITTTVEGIASLTSHMEKGQIFQYSFDGNDKLIWHGADDIVFFRKN